MSDTNDGGPAFPGQATKGSSWTDEDGVLNHDFNSGPGMSLRDHFAGQALAGMLADPNFSYPDTSTAWAAYVFADAMLAARDATRGTS